MDAGPLLVDLVVKIFDIKAFLMFTPIYASCLKASFAVTQECPICRTGKYGKIDGIQPKNATMTVVRAKRSLPGYESCGTIIIECEIPSGIQTVSACD